MDIQKLIGHRVTHVTWGPGSITKSVFVGSLRRLKKQDTKNSMSISHGAIGWNCCMCPTARWIGFEPITSAFG